jgi:hypothetical protein
MNVKATGLFCALLLLTSALLQAKEGEKAATPSKPVPGGIVARSKKSKDVCYYDFALKKTTRNLTEDDEQKPDIFAISLDGKTLLRASKENSMQLQFRILPCRGDNVIKTFVYGDPKKLPTQMTYFLCDDAETLAVSPGGNKFSFECLRTGKSLSRVATNPAMRGKLYANAPWYEYQEDTYHQVHFSKISQSLTISDDSGCGNTAFFPPTCPYRVIGQHVLPHYVGRTLVEQCASDWPEMSDTWTRGTALVPQECVKRYAVKRDAYFGVWSNDNELFAAIYHSSNGCCIEINDSTPFFKMGQGYERRIAGVKPGYYEIPVSLNNCKGMAWKPDGSLTYLSNNKVYSLDGEKIREGISYSGLAVNPSRDTYIPIPVNNVFSITPKLVAEGISATKYYWVSDSAFIFRNEEGELMLWSKGTTEKLLSHVPETFFYCNIAPPKYEPKPEVKTVPEKQTKEDLIDNVPKKKPVTEGVVKKTRVFQTLASEFGQCGKISIGSIKSEWIADCTTTSSVHNNVCIRVRNNTAAENAEIKKACKGKPPVQLKIKPLEFVILRGTDIDSIEDPSIYKYQEGESSVYGSEAISKKDSIILKLDNTYVAIKLLSWEKKLIDKKFNFSYESPVCEYKFWPEATPEQSPELARTVKTPKGHEKGAEKVPVETGTK